jgi:hypothetical protein
MPKKYLLAIGSKGNPPKVQCHGQKKYLFAIGSIGCVYYYNDDLGPIFYMAKHMITSRLHQIGYLSLSPAMQNTEYPCHDVARQQKPSSSQQKKLQRIESAQSTILITNIHVKMKPTTLTENMVEASSSFPSLSEMDNACRRSNSAINCKTK